MSTSLFEKDNVELTFFAGGQYRGFCYRIDQDENHVEVTTGQAARLAVEILKDVFFGNGKPVHPAEAVRILEQYVTRVEANPKNWWNSLPGSKPEVES